MSTNYLTIKEASEFLQVTPLTLRNWDKSGKLKASRHPMNNYRVYKKENLEKILADIETGTTTVHGRKKAVVRKLVVKHLDD